MFGSRSPEHFPKKKSRLFCSVKNVWSFKWSCWGQSEEESNLINEGLMLLLIHGELFLLLATLFSNKSSRCHPSLRVSSQVKQPERSKPPLPGIIPPHTEVPFVQSDPQSKVEIPSYIWGLSVCVCAHMCVRAWDRGVIEALHPWVLIRGLMVHVVAVETFVWT